MMENFSDFLSDPSVTKAAVTVYLETSKKPLFMDKYAVCTTSGSSGTAGCFLYDLRTLATLRSLTYSRWFSPYFSWPNLLSQAVKGRGKWAMLIALREHNVTYQLTKLLPPIWNALIDHRFYSVLQPLEQHLDALQKFNPDLLHAYPTALGPLAEYQRMGRLNIQPKFITSASEPFDDRLKQDLKAIFPTAALLEAYGCTEFTGIANECPAGHLHLNEDYCVLEAVDRHGQSVAIGEPSEKVLLTNLVNYLQPIIRYELSDSIVYSGKKCVCGSPLPVLHILGRAEDTVCLIRKDAQVVVVPPKHFHLVFFRVKGLLQYQLTHVEQNKLEVRFSCRESFDPADLRLQLERQLRSYMQEHGLNEEVTLDLRSVAQIERNAKSGKIKSVMSLVPSLKSVL